MGIRYSALPGHTMELAEALNEVLSGKWRNLRGLEIVSFGVSSVKASEEDEQMIKELQRNAAFMDPTRAAAHLVGAQASAMQAAAANQGAGPAMAFMGMNMAGQAGGMNAQNLYQMGAAAAGAAAHARTGQRRAGCRQAGRCCHAAQTRQHAANSAPSAASAEARSRRTGWTCALRRGEQGQVLRRVRQAQDPPACQQYKCDKCGWEPEDPTHPPKFCPECGDPFDDGDQI